MKGRESGMPDEALWATFFRPEEMLDRLLPAGATGAGLVEFGCGYGTFTLPAARRTRGLVTALDIEPELVALVRRRAGSAALDNVRVELRDFIAQGTGLAPASQGHAMVFNLLHIEEPAGLLREACRVLQPGGTLSVIHWRSDIETPRGPPLSIRPTPAQCTAWLTRAGFDAVTPVALLASAPYHFGLLARKPVSDPLIV